MVIEKFVVSKCLVILIFLRGGGSSIWLVLVLFHVVFKTVCFFILNRVVSYVSGQVGVGFFLGGVGFCFFVVIL